MARCRRWIDGAFERIFAHGPLGRALSAHEAFERTRVCVWRILMAQLSVRCLRELSVLDRARARCLRGLNILVS